MSSLERYIMREVLKPFAFVLFILVALFACFSSARYLEQAVAETLGIYFMLKLVILKTFIALEVLAPVALYISVVAGLGRLHRAQEIVAMRAAGAGQRLLTNAVVLLALLMGILTGALSLYGRPWAYQSSYVLDAKARTDLNADRFQPGRFYGNEDTGAVIYIDEKDARTDALTGIFHYIRAPGFSEVMVAATGVGVEESASVGGGVSLKDGYLYRLQRNAEDDELVRYEKLVKFQDEPTLSIGYQRKAASTAQLLASDRPEDVAEAQWRLSRPIATLLLALLAIPLSRATPRQGRGEKTFLAALVFAVYYNLSGVARSWVEQGVVDKFPGIWWLHVLMAALALILLTSGFGGRRSR